MKKHFHLSALILLGALSSSNLWAKFTIDKSLGPSLDYEINRFSEINQKSTRSFDHDASPGCKERYQKLYSKGVLRIVLGMGYGDSTPGRMMWDYFGHHSIMKRLLRPCTADVSLCGFRQDRKDPNLLRKVAFDPTAEKKYRIELRIIRASLTPDHNMNMSSERSFKQFLACTQATIDFHKQVASGSDIVIYAGHSRDGGGPDFCPPIKTKNNHVNYSWYQQNKPGITRLAESLKLAVNKGTPNQVVGLFSCSSQLHFLKKMRSVNNTAGYLVTKRTATFHELYMDTFSALDGLLSQRCKEGFELSFNERGASTWRNMFKREF